jgi:maltooligosyltrehalose trehalohydrolase
VTSIAFAPPVLGAFLDGSATRFGAWAPGAKACAVRLFDDQAQPITDHAMERGPEGHWQVAVEGVRAGALYAFVVDDRQLPDPYARCVPRGVHAPAAVAGSAHGWQFGPGIARPMSEHVIYELHVGTFTEEGTFRAAIGHFAELANLGFTAIELMPVAAFDGARGWGYDGVAPYAPHPAYGTPDDLRRLVDEAHGLGLSVILDVVYNHYGPSGNYLGAYDPAYFDDTIHTAWGAAPDFRHPVLRRHVIDLARHWLEGFRFDGLRLDATHAILDRSEKHVLCELVDVVRSMHPKKLLIAEDERNDPSMITLVGLDGVWADDFHHQVRVTLTGERDGYYAAYQPGAAGIARAIERGWLYEGQVYPPSGKARGGSADAVPASALVYCIQNHDQIGNRALGERLSALVPEAAHRAVTLLLLFLPATPLLFMGQEWGATTPFLYFTDHEPGLGERISAGRREEFKDFDAFSDPGSRALIPDPQAEETFLASRLRWSERDEGAHAAMVSLVREALALRRTDEVLRDHARERMKAEAHGEVLVVRRWLGEKQRWIVVNFGDTPVELDEVGVPIQAAHCLLASEKLGDEGRALPPKAAVLLCSED